MKQKHSTMERVDISRSILVCHVFQFFFASAKASLLPFLTLFFRLMGLTAIETGIIMAAKTLTGFVWAPLWARCAIAYNKRRIVLVFSLIIMAMNYLTMTVVYNQVANKQFDCNRSFQSDGSLLQDGVNKSHSNISYITISNNVISIKHVNISTTSTTHTTIRHRNFTGESKRSTFSFIAPISTLAPRNTEKSKQSKFSAFESNDVMQGLLKNYKRYVDEVKQGSMSSKQLFNLLNKHIPDAKLSTRDVDEIWNYMRVMSDKDRERHERSVVMSSEKTRQKRDFTRSWSDISDKIKRMMSGLKEKELELFLIILLLVILGEFLCSPIEKVADDAWFDFLECIDDLEKYGKQRLSGSIAFIFIPVIITLIVDNTECILPYNIHHFLIHFYLFAIFLGITVIVAFFYPIPLPGKQKYVSKVAQGMRILCCDYRSFLYIITLLLLGMVYASFNNYLFWFIQDLGGKEITMGLCVTIGALAEIPMLLLSGKMIKKLGNAGVVSVSLLAMAVRVLYYSFLWTPWAVLPAELMHAFTHTAMWYAVLSYDDYNVGPAVDRSIRSILSSVYFGVGFSVGSVVSGVVFDLFGSSVMYWGASALCAIWSVVFLVVQKCLPKKERIRYIRLVPGEDGLDSGGDDEDWLEMALKEQ